MDTVYNYLENREVAIGIYLDLQKAFAIVIDEMLLYTMFTCDIRGNISLSFKSYLPDRQ